MPASTKTKSFADYIKNWNLDAKEVNGDFRTKGFLLAEVIISKISLFDEYAFVEVTPLDEDFEGNVSFMFSGCCYRTL